MNSLKTLLSKYWSLGLVALFILLWFKAHDQVVAERALSAIRADSLQAARRQIDSVIAVNSVSRDSVQRLVRQLNQVQAAAAHRQAIQQAQNDSAIAAVMSQVPDSVKGAVQALQDGFNRERADFHSQIETLNRSVLALQNQVADDSTTILGLHSAYNTANQGWVKCERRGPSVVGKVVGVGTKVLAVYGLVRFIGH